MTCSDLTSPRQLRKDYYYKMRVLSKTVTLLLLGAGICDAIAIPSLNGIFQIPFFEKSPYHVSEKDKPLINLHRELIQRSSVTGNGKYDILRC